MDDQVFVAPPVAEVAAQAEEPVPVSAKVSLPLNISVPAPVRADSSTLASTAASSPGAAAGKTHVIVPFYDIYEKKIVAVHFYHPF